MIEITNDTTGMHDHICNDCGVILEEDCEDILHVKAKEEGKEEAEFCAQCEETYTGDQKEEMKSLTEPTDEDEEATK